MTLLLLTSITLSIILILPLSTSPLILGALIWLLALLTALLTAFIHSSWFGFIIFLIYIGGMLVMFAYFSAVAPNQQMKFNFSQVIPLILASLTMITMLYKLATMPILTTTLMPPFPSPQTKLSIILWTAPFLLLAFILFLALVAVTKIVFQARYPLRPFNSYV
uniref:NADH dehydrogenase subunit 6 n=1 Tax=Sternaspis sendalli TaxID=2607893 RepID=UPI00226CFE4B|nr:NADH dehydrogenase subunit 6 [Sternaspis sendalli]UZP47201.1 NADH dehydrogenase subunit 6 [Sternaspis sendalli]